MVYHRNIKNRIPCNWCLPPQNNLWYRSGKLNHVSCEPLYLDCVAYPGFPRLSFWNGKHFHYWQQPKHKSQTWLRMVIPGRHYNQYVQADKVYTPGRNTHFQRPLLYIFFKSRCRSFFHFFKLKLTWKINIVNFTVIIYFIFLEMIFPEMDSKFEKTNTH